MSRRALDRDHRWARRPTSWSRTTSSAFPALAASGRPWVRIGVGCNPTELKDPAVPPFSSGYPVADRHDWPAFLGRGSCGPIATCGMSSTRSLGSTATPGSATGPAGPDFISESPWLNLYVYPAEADYPRARPLGPTWHRGGLVRCAPGCDMGAARAPARQRRGAHLPVARQPRVRRRRIDATPRGRARHVGAPDRRVEGTVGRPDHAARQPDRGELPAAAGHPAPGRPGDHAWRQQHGHRGVPPPASP